MDMFGVANSGGMRRSLKNDVLLLIHNTINSIYEDRWKNGVLYYTGMGLIGNQDINFSQNKTLANAHINGIQVLLFEMNKKNRYEYVAEVELIDEPFYESQRDDKNNVRQVIIFPLGIKK